MGIPTRGYEEADRSNRPGTPHRSANAPSPATSDKTTLPTLMAYLHRRSRRDVAAPVDHPSCGRSFGSFHVHSESRRRSLMSVMRAHRDGSRRPWHAVEGL